MLGEPVPPLVDLEDNIMEEEDHQVDPGCIEVCDKLADILADYWNVFGKMVVKREQGILSGRRFAALISCQSYQLYI